MKFTSSEYERDKRLAVAAFLRENNSQNKERLLHIHSILSGEPLPMKEYDSETLEKNQPDNEEKAFWRSFRMRCFVAILLTAGIYIGMISGDSEITLYMNRIKAEIAADYSENLFDFIQQIPYTLDYEKINA